jgi:hypothetical protein
MSDILSSKVFILINALPIYFKLSTKYFIRVLLIEEFVLQMIIFVCP